MSRAKGTLRSAILIAAHTGARIEEVSTLVYDDRTDLITFPKSKTSAGLRVIPCPLVIREVVKAWKGVSSSYLGVSFTRLKRSLGFPDKTKTFHSLRHTVATKLATSGCPEHLAALVLGHTHKALSYGHYGRHVDPEVLREHLERVRYEQGKGQG